MNQAPHHTLARVAGSLVAVVLVGALAPTVFASASAEPSVVRVNAGTRSSYTDHTGAVWASDKYFRGGSRYSTSATIAGTTDQTLYQTERYGMSSWDKSLANGRYHVRLLEAELYFTEPGKRVFSVAAEGQTVAANVDIVARVGARTADEIAFDVDVRDGQLNLTFTDKVNHAKVGAIEVTPVADVPATVPSSTTTTVAATPETTTTTAPPATPAPTTTTMPPPAPMPELPPAPTITPVGSRALSWAPPALSSPITVDASDGNRTLKLDPSRDYIVRITSPITASGGLSIIGGHNVVLIGGEINLPAWYTTADPSKPNRGLYLKGWTGTMHVEGVQIAGVLAEGIDVDTRTPGAVLQVENVRIDKVTGSYDTNHADIIQNWAGPSVYRIDGLTASSSYQGLFLQSTQFGSVTDVADFRHINLAGADGGGRYLLYRCTGAVANLALSDVWLQPGGAWSSEDGTYGLDRGPVSGTISHGTPPNGDFVPAAVVGMGYVSPGYVG